MLRGYKNELDFCNKFNGKRLNELDDYDQKFILKLFNGKVTDNSYIMAYKIITNEKPDIIIKIDDVKKFISIKSGSSNSVHLEKLSVFLDFLKSINCNSESLYIYSNFHSGLNSEGRRVTSKEYQLLYPLDLLKLNNDLNDEFKLNKAIDRFLFTGVNVYNPVDYMIYETPSNYKYASREEITNYLLKKNDTYLAPHFSNLVIQPWGRNLGENYKYEYCKSYVQIKWYNLDIEFDNIMNKE